MAQRQRILVIDNSKYFNPLWQLLLPETEFEVTGLAGDPDQAVAMAATHTPDLALVDLGPEGMAGLSPIIALRAAHPELPIVALSSFSFGEYTRIALEAGATACLEKSELAETLLPTIAKLVPGHPLVTRGLAGQTSRWQPVRDFLNTEAMVVVRRHLLYMGMGLVSGTMGVALTMWLAVMAQSWLPPSTTFSPGTLSLLILAAVASVGVTWYFNRLTGWLAPRLPYHLKAEALQMVLVASTSTSVLQTLLFTRGW
jgi:DNA-binding NarL/FixJ family response regulator